MSLCATRREREFRRRQLLSSESDNSPLTEGLPFDISIPPVGCRLVAPVIYRGRKAMVIEYEEPSEGDMENCAVALDAKWPALVRSVYLQMADHNIVHE